METVGETSSEAAGEIAQEYVFLFTHSDDSSSCISTITFISMHYMLWHNFVTVYGKGFNKNHFC
jgi:hypothetical protein